MHTPSHARSGFTLIELLAVIVILSILIVVLVPRLAGFGERANEKATKAFLAQLDVAIAEYENRFGDYPPSHFPDAWARRPTPPTWAVRRLWCRCGPRIGAARAWRKTS